jgi:hypothetical protein
MSASPRPSRTRSRSSGARASERHHEMCLSLVSVSESRSEPSLAAARGGKTQCRCAAPARGAAGCSWAASGAAGGRERGRSRNPGSRGAVLTHHPAPATARRPPARLRPRCRRRRRCAAPDTPAPCAAPPRAGRRSAGVVVPHEGERELELVSEKQPLPRHQGTCRVSSDGLRASLAQAVHGARSAAALPVTNSSDPREESDL